jgi:uncharacterized membrane protein YhaH (DUF805 family)
MFQNPFSFNGRISRTEYGLSIIFSLLIFFVSIFLANFLYGDFVFIFCFFTYFWFNLAQGCKRCHDLNQSGFMQFVPFYFITLIFEDGSDRLNEYGKNPKLEDHKQEKALLPIKGPKTIFTLTQKILPFALLTTILVVLVILFFNTYDFLFYMSLYITIVFSFFLFIAFTKMKYISLLIRLIFCFLVYVFLRFYAFLFLNYEYKTSYLTLEFSTFIVGLALTYMSPLIYKTINKNI